MSQADDWMSRAEWVCQADCICWDNLGRGSGSRVRLDIGSVGVVGMLV